MTFDFSPWKSIGLTVSGFKIVLADEHKLTIEHKPTGRLYTVTQQGEYFCLWASSLAIDGPNVLGTFVMKTTLLRNILLAVGCLRK